nr:hypothetical protein SHINE37_41893 [Rhizobiaceae bacterium]
MFSRFGERRKYPGVMPLRHDGGALPAGCSGKCRNGSQMVYARQHLLKDSPLEFNAVRNSCNRDEYRRQYIDRQDHRRQVAQP